MNRIERLIAEMCPEGVEFRQLGNLCKVETGKLNANEAKEDGKYAFFTTARDISRINKYRWDLEALLVAGNANVGDVKHFIGKFEAYQRTYVLTDFDGSMEVRFIFHVLKNGLQRYLEGRTNRAAMTYIVLSSLEAMSIPVPPLKVQREIVSILDKFTQLEAELEAELEARKQQYEHYRAELLKANKSAAQLTLGDIGRVAMCKRIFKDQTSSSGDVPFFKIGTFGGEPDAFISHDLYEQYRERFSFPNAGDILISAAGTIGRAIPYDGEPAYFQDSNIVWLAHDESVVLNGYLRHWYEIVNWSTDGGTIKRLYNSNILKTHITVPPLEEQRRIVSILDKFDALVNDISIGLPAELAARRQQYEYYRDKMLTFKELDAAS